jgi:hypothetical protein
VAGFDCAGASTAIEHVRLLTRFDLAGWLAAVPLGERHWRTWTVNSRGSLPASAYAGASDATAGGGGS